MTDPTDAEIEAGALALAQIDEQDYVASKGSYRERAEAVLRAAAQAREAASSVFTKGEVPTPYKRDSAFQDVGGESRIGWSSGAVSDQSPQPSGKDVVPADRIGADVIKASVDTNHTTDAAQSAGIGGVPNKRPELAQLVENAKAKLAAMSPEEREAMWAAQRESWGRQDHD